MVCAIRGCEAAKDGGARRDRTDDLKLAKLALSQLSYGPIRQTKVGVPSEAAKQRRMVGPGRVERPTSRLSGVRSNHLSYEPVLENGIQKSGIRRSKRAGLESEAGMSKQIEARKTHSHF